MPTRLRIVVTGLAATYPFGGVFWDYIQYLRGLRLLGHEAIYLEDTGRWCYDPVRETFGQDGSNSARWLDRHLRRLDPDLADRWHFRDARGVTFGMSPAAVADFCASADLLLHISAATVLRDPYLAVRRTVFLDSDPMYTQAGLFSFGDTGPEARGKLDWWTAHHHRFFTFGLNLGRPGCGVPAGPIRWRTTVQPVVIRDFLGRGVAPRGRRPLLTTVASWEPHEKGTHYLGRPYHGKSAEFLRFLDLPRRLPVGVEVAMSGPAPRDRLADHGWRIRRALDVSFDPWVYRDYLAGSTAELGIAKHAYVATASGWFSCRSACYLALGVPVIAQDTGWSERLPTGRGLLAFTDHDDARAAVENVLAHPRRHARAAREIAVECFDSAKVLRRLIDQALND